MGTGESSSRARGDKEGPNGAASSARLIHGLQRTKEERRRRATGPPFSARNGPPTRARRTNPMVAGSIPAGRALTRHYVVIHAYVIMLVTRRLLPKAPGGSFLVRQQHFVIIRRP